MRQGGKTLAEREELTIAVLNAPANQTHRAVGESLGISRETVRRVRYGIMWASIRPDIERLTQTLGTPGRGTRCDQCVHWKPERIRDRSHGSDMKRLGICTLGIPESISPLYARGCGAFMEPAAALS